MPARVRRSMILLALALGACHGGAGEPSADEYLASHKAAVTAKLARLRRIADEVKRAPAPTAASRVRDPGVAVHLCAYNTNGHIDKPMDRSGHVVEDVPCNTRIIELDWLADWRCMRESHHDPDDSSYLSAVDNQRFQLIDWYVDTASLIERGEIGTGSAYAVGEDGRKIPPKPRPLQLWDVQRPFEAFDSVRFLIVIRPGAPGYDAFLYDVDGPTALGSFHFEPEGGEIHDYVWASGPDAGKPAYSTDSWPAVTRDMLSGELFKRLADVTVYAPS
jgi:hypothetical protein